MKKNKCTLITKENIDLFKHKMVQFLNKYPHLQEQTTWLDNVTKDRFNKSIGLKISDDILDKVVLKTHVFYFSTKICTFSKSDNAYYLHFNDGCHTGDLVKVGDRIKILPNRIIQYSTHDILKSRSLSITKTCNESDAKKNILRYKLEAEFYDEVCREEFYTN